MTAPASPHQAAPLDSVVGLDELLRYEPEGAPEHWAVRRLDRRQLTATALYPLLVALAAWGLLATARLEIPFPLLYMLALAPFAVYRAMIAVAEPFRDRTTNLVRGRSAPHGVERGGWYEGGDGLVRAVRRWETRLDWSSTERLRFARRIPVMLSSIVDERLRLRHGFIRAADPAKARQLCGEPLWNFLHEPLSRVPSEREMAALVAQMERL